MIAHKLDLTETLVTATVDKEEEYSIPLDISDIISICRDYNNLGGRIQNQIDNILEFGVEESIQNKAVTKESLPYILNFLQQITKNPYFGDAVSQANECIFLIKEYQNKILSLKLLQLN